MEEQRQKVIDILKRIKDYILLKNFQKPMVINMLTILEENDIDYKQVAYLFEWKNILYEYLSAEDRQMVFEYVNFVYCLFTLNGEIGN